MLFECLLQARSCVLNADLLFDIIRGRPSYILYALLPLMSVALGVYHIISPPYFDFFFRI